MPLIRRVNPAYTSIIGKYKYSGSHNLSVHTLASYVIARRGLGFKDEDDFPSIYTWALAQIGGIMQPRLKPSAKHYNWLRIQDLFKRSGITSYSTAEIIRTVLLVKHVLGTGNLQAQPNNLKAGFTRKGKVDDWHKFWNHVRSVAGTGKIQRTSNAYNQCSVTSSA